MTKYFILLIIIAAIILAYLLYKSDKKELAIAITILFITFMVLIILAFMGI